MNDVPLVLRIYSAVWRYRHIAIALGVMIISASVIHLVTHLSATRPIIVATAPISAGHTITDSDVDTMTVAAADLPSTVASDIDSVVGTIATVDIDAGDLIVDPMIAQSPTARISQGQVAISVAVDATSASVLHPGSHVVFYCDNDVAIEAQVISVSPDDNDTLSAAGTAAVAHVAVADSQAGALVRFAQQKPLYAVVRAP